MHQDQRIGLALGVLLVGACAAFFFRNDNRPVQYLPRLQHAKELDERIAEKSNRPYLKGVETIEEADRRKSGPLLDPVSIDAATAQTSLHTWNPLNLFQSRSEAPRSEQSRKLREGSGDSSDGWMVELQTPVEASDESVASREAVTESNAHGDWGTSDSVGSTHVVQRGETLSSIAAKLLGDRGRFQEIFEANRDQLDDPNDVKLGMTLKVPDSVVASNLKPSDRRPHARQDRSLAPVMTSAPASSIRTAPRLAKVQPELPAQEDVDSARPQVPTPIDEPTADSTVETTPQVEETAAPKKFVPARRSPLPPRPSQDNAGRRLSQIPLDSTSGKVAR